MEVVAVVEVVAAGAEAAEEAGLDLVISGSKVEIMEVEANEVRGFNENTT